MTKNSDYALLSLEVYRNSEDDILLPPGRLPTNWQVFYDFIPNDNDRGYFGSAYINKLNSKVVIAHRGTEPTDPQDFYNDFLLSALEDATNQYRFVAKVFVDEVKLLFTQRFPNLDPKQYITHTGHSLGAFISELCAARDNVKAVNFDSPGSLQNMEKLVNSGELTSSDIIFSNQNIINLLVTPHVVNAAKWDRMCI